MRIGVIVPHQRPNPLYRALWPMEELRRRGHTVGMALVERESQLPSIDVLTGFDAIYVWRMHQPALRRALETAQRSGVAVAWDIDDDITTVPRGSANYRKVGGINGQRVWTETQAMIKLADVVTTPSEMLADRFRRIGQEHVHVIENYVPTVTKPRRSKGPTVVGWVAAGEHSTDVKPLGLRAAFTRLLAERPDVEVSTVGIALDLDSPRYRRTTIVPLFELPAQIAQFDIGVAPLTDIAFNRARSNIKLKEYAAGGVPWLASPVGPYVGLGAAQGGRLVGDDEWYDALLALVDDGRERGRLAGNAHAWAKGQTIAGNAERWERILAAAIERARARVASGARIG